LKVQTHQSAALIIDYAARASSHRRENTVPNIAPATGPGLFSINSRLGHYQFFPALFDRLYFQERNYFPKSHPLFSLQMCLGTQMQDTIFPQGVKMALGMLN